MVNKIKIPSKYVMIVGHYLYKGYRGFVKERADKRGNFLTVILESSGMSVNIFIENIVFITPNLKFYKYVKENGLAEYVLKEYNKKLNLSDKDIEDITDNLKKLSIGSNPEKDTETFIHTEEESEEMVVSYDNLQHIRQDIRLNEDQITMFLSQLVKFLEINYDNLSINIYGKKIQEIMRLPEIVNRYTFDELFYKLFIVAYMFIHLNNLGISIPRYYTGCNRTPNDDISYLLCLVLRSNFLELKKSGIELTEKFVQDMKEFLENDIIPSLLNVLNTTIIPSIPIKQNEISKRKDIVKKIKVLSKVRQSKITKSKQNFLLKPKPVKISKNIRNTVKNSIIEQLNSEIKKSKDTGKVAMGKFVLENFDILVNENPNVIQKIKEMSPELQSILIPIIEEYQNHSFILENFQQKISKEKQSNQEISMEVINKVKGMLIEKLKTIEGDGKETKLILEFIINNIEYIATFDKRYFPILINISKLSKFSTKFQERLINVSSMTQEKILETIREEEIKDKLTDENSEKLIRNISKMSLI